MSENGKISQVIGPVVDVVFDGVCDTVDYHLRKLLPGDRYYRFQVELTEGKDDMDDAGPTNLRVLKLLAERLVREQTDVLDAACASLVG